MEIFRITQENFAADISGNGAKIFGGRWNSEGRCALYTSGTRSLALLETLVHTPAKMLRSKSYILITLIVPDNETIQIIQPESLLSGWNDVDASLYTKKIGDAFLLQNQQLLLQVPSVVLPEECNFVLNPLHKGMKKVKIKHRRRVLFDAKINLER